MTDCLYCGKSDPKRKEELPAEQQHMACRDEHSKRIREGKCVVCNDKDGWGHSCGDLPEGAILEEYVDTGKVNMIFKDYNIIGPDSINASHGAHCAGDQDLFWEYHDILYSNWTGENNGWASLENLARYAQEVDLDMNAWSECMDKRPHSQRILASNNDAKALELTGTPAFFVIGPDSSQPITRLFGAQPLETFQRVFDERLGE